jgi:hypothetical protein
MYIYYDNLIKDSLINPTKPSKKNPELHLVSPPSL